LEDLIAELKEIGHEHKLVLDSCKKIVGIVWVRQDMKDLFQKKHGHLVELDATHNTNGHKWLLFNLAFKEKFGTWMAGAHMLLVNEQGETIGAGLKGLRTILPRWKPRYFLVDDNLFSMPSAH
jgi:hypothetical protein